MEPFCFFAPRLTRTKTVAGGYDKLAFCLDLLSKCKVEYAFSTFVGQKASLFSKYLDSDQDILKYGIYFCSRKVENAYSTFLEQKASPYFKIPWLKSIVFEIRLAFCPTKVELRIGLAFNFNYNL